MTTDILNKIQTFIKRTSLIDKSFLKDSHLNITHKQGKNSVIYDLGNGKSIFFKLETRLNNYCTVLISIRTQIEDLVVAEGSIDKINDYYNLKTFVDGPWWEDINSIFDLVSAQYDKEKEMKKQKLLEFQYRKREFEQLKIDQFISVWRR